jgi:hypothetical protein
MGIVTVNPIPFYRKIILYSLNPMTAKICQRKTHYKHQSYLGVNVAELLNTNTHSTSADYLQMTTYVDSVKACSSL